MLGKLNGSLYLHTNSVLWGTSLRVFSSNLKIRNYGQNKISERHVVPSDGRDARHGRTDRLENAQQMFMKLPKGNLFTWNSMITRYVQNSMIEDAAFLFDRMPQRNVVSWTSMISGFCQHGRLDDARKLFDKMPERDSIAWNSMITGYAKNGKMEDARILFDEMPERDSVSWNSMIRRYMQCGSIEDASELFEKMPGRDMASWNTMIVGYCQNGRIENARRMFDEMPQRNVVSWTAMVAGYAQNGNIEDAFELFVKMPERNVVSWTAMVSGYAQSGRMEDAQQLFDKMPVRNVVSWNAMIAGYAREGKMLEAQRLFDKMSGQDVVSWTSMISGYAQIGRIEDARALFDRVPHHDAVAWNAIIAGYTQNGQGQAALTMFSKMQLAGMKPDLSTLVSILSASASLAALQQGKQVHQHIISVGLMSNSSMGNAIITMYAKCGSIEDAHKSFNRIHERNLVSWNAMISGYAQHGLGNEALEVFEQMQQTGTKPDHITFVGVLSGCSHAGLVDKGFHYFELLIHSYGIQPTAEHYACMVDLLGRSGNLDEVEVMIKKMPFKPDVVIWGSLLGACRIHGNTELAKWAAEHLVELRPQDATPYVLLSNIYAAAGRWDDVAKVRKMMKDRGVEKEPGCSWIETRNKVHRFLVGDRSHPQTEEIYATLERLAGLMEKEGYVPDANFVLQNVEEENKERILLYHSEKLAVAFGLISTYPGSPIRIVKNLRVCGDCHTAIKFISKIIGREIIVRDANRFHHFKEGLCSCRDYW